VVAGAVVKESEAVINCLAVHLLLLRERALHLKDSQAVTFEVISPVSLHRLKVVLAAKPPTKRSAEGVQAFASATSRPTEPFLLTPAQMAHWPVGPKA
jgi:hypothetical protein